MIDLTTCANVKRVTLSDGEVAALLQTARRCLAESPFRNEPVAIHPLALSESTQTYRVTGSERTAILKMSPPRAADLSARVHRFLARRGVEVPAVIWTDLREGALLQEDVGAVAVPADPDVRTLLAIVRYLARLHDASTMDERTARAEFPDLAAGGFPTPARLAANIVQRYGEFGWGAAATVDLAEALAATAPPRPSLAISDVKREHFVFRNGAPVLVDLEMASFWDVPAANLATLFAFPGQFTDPIPAEVRSMLLAEYVTARASAPRDLERLSRAVDAAETLLAATLSHAAATWRSTPAPMTRDRRFRASRDDSSSVEEEIGAASFGALLAALRQESSVRLLDVGSGIGRTLRDVAESFPHHHLVGVDVDPAPTTPGGVAANAQALPFPDQLFDAAIAVQLLQYVPDKLRAIEEVYRVLRPGGVAVFAMTEHFGSESAFVPPLPAIVATVPGGMVRGIATSRVRSRRVMQFALTRHADVLRFPFALRAAVEREGSDAAPPYLQSRYEWVSFGGERTGSR